MSLQSTVEDFHNKYGFPTSIAVDDCTCFDGEQALAAIATPLHVIEHEIKRAANDDVRVARVHLIVEETRELVQALLDKDEVEVADALTDLAYVVIGSFVTWGMPLEQLFEEVHRSNMTKDTDGRHKPRKGVNFSPPDIARIIV